MPVVPRRGLLAIAAVIDVHTSGRPVSAETIAACHKLPPRHLEPVLQALVRDGILRGIRGPHGGYELGRNGDQISADDILQAASAVGDIGEPLPGSALVNEVVRPALAEIERMFSAALERIVISDLIKLAEALK